MIVASVPYIVNDLPDKLPRIQPNKKKSVVLSNFINFVNISFTNKEKRRFNGDLLTLGWLFQIFSIYDVFLSWTEQIECDYFHYDVNKVSKLIINKSWKYITTMETCI